jgi:hypothetical protein
MAGVSRDLLDALYSAPPEGFVAARDDAVASARAAGNLEAAREIAKLRKPTVAAWLVNLLAIRRPELMSDLVELSAALRSAQRELRGAQLRELSAQRRDAVNALVAQARALAVEANAGMPAGKLPLAEVEATLNAALSDADVAQQVRSGRLVRPVSYAGFGEVPRPQLRLMAGGAGEAAPERMPEGRAGAGAAGAKDRGAEAGRDRNRRAEEAARAKQRKALARELADARTQQKRAESQLARAVAAERDGAGALAAVEAALAELERRRAAAEQEIGRHRLARKEAERATVAARRRTGEVEAAVEALDAESGAVEDPVRQADSTR